MEKLIKLIDEYELKWRNWKGWSWIESDKDVFLKQENIIWKRYWFIKWLVENDKIDFDKLEDNSDWYFIDLSDNYLEILALLSIQDNPIEFLISILKDKKVRTVYVDEDWNVSWDTKRYSDC